MFYKFVLGHVVCDFALQSGSMAHGKNRHIAPEPGTAQYGSRVFWPYWMTAHAIIHGGAVWFITGSVVLGLLETVLHWMIDYAKCEGWTNIHSDQLLHLAAKGVYVFLV